MDLSRRKGAPYLLETIPRNHAECAFGLSYRSAETILDMGRYLGCFDPRDRVYSVLSLLGPCLTKRIRPEYRATVPQVYGADFASFCKTT